MPDKTTTSTTISAFGRHPCPRLLSAYSTALQKVKQICGSRKRKNWTCWFLISQNRSRAVWSSPEQSYQGRDNPGCPC